MKANPDICSSLIIDTADWAERLCINNLCEKNQVSGIEGFGYGKGYVYLEEEFGRFLNRAVGSHRSWNQRRVYGARDNAKV